MESLLLLLLTNAGSAALLALLASAVSRVVRRPAVGHALWLLALVKLVTPPVLPLPLLPELRARLAPLRETRPIVVPMTSEAASAVALAAEPIRAHGTVEARVSEGRAFELAPAPRYRADVFAGPGAASGAEEASLGAPVAAAAQRRAAAAAAALVLAVGASAVLGLAALRFRRFRRLLRHARPAPPELLDRAESLALELGLRRAPPVLVVDAPIPPMLWPEPAGPRLLLPRELLNELREPECAALLAHELAHVRRRDHWVRLLELLATALFWWYPVAWWARGALRRAEERCCDEWVLRVLPRSAEAYAQGLLKSLSFVSQAPVAVPALASGASPLYDLELRLKEILMTRPAPRLAAPVRLALAAAALLGLAVHPTQAREQSAPAAPAPEAAADAPAPAPEAPAAAPAAVAAAPEPARTSAPATAARQASPTLPRQPAPSRQPAPWRQPAPPAPPGEPGDVLLRTPAPGAPMLAPLSPGAWSGSTLLPPTPLTLMAPGLPAKEAAEIDERRASIESRRRGLQKETLELERQEIELRAQSQKAELHAEAQALRARGEAERAALLDRQGELATRRAALEARRLELQVAQLELEARVAADERRQAEKLRALERESAGAAHERAQALRRQVEDELLKRQREFEDEARALERKTRELGREEQVQAMTAATEEVALALVERANALERALAEDGAGQPELERELERLRKAIEALGREGPAAGASQEPRAKPKPTPQP